MPCDSITTAKVEIDIKNTDINLLGAALKELGFTEQVKGQSWTNWRTFENVSFRNGKLSGNLDADNKQDRMNAIKKAYSHKVVQATAKKYNWKLKKIDEDEYEVEKD